MKQHIHVHIHIHNTDCHLALDKNAMAKNYKESKNLNSNAISSRFENDLSVHKNQLQDWPNQNIAKSAHLFRNVQDYDKIRLEDHKKNSVLSTKGALLFAGKTALCWLVTAVVG